jgi:hypothetical protein
MGDLQWATTNDWLEVQNQSFLSWVNHYLEPIGMPVTDFTTDLADGLRLIALCEVLSGVKIPRYVKNPKFAAQKMANITEALDFMTKHFGIKFVGCNAQDIMDGKQSQCMGVVFLLINKIKQIGLESDSATSMQTSGSSGNLTSPPSTPKSLSSDQDMGTSPPRDTAPITSPRRMFDRQSPSAAITRPSVAKKPHTLTVGARDSPTSVTIGLKQQDQSQTTSAASPKKQRPVVPARYKSTSSANVVASSATPALTVAEDVPSDPEKRKEYYIVKLQAAARAFLARKKFATLKSQQKELMARLMSDAAAQKKVIRLQATVRGMITRNIPILRARRKRNEIVKEILTTEDKYVKQLTVLVNVYMKALESLGESLLPAAKIRSIFSEIKVIVSYNTVILNMLQARVQKWFESEQVLGDIFLRFTDFLKVYTAYVNNYNESMSTMQDQMINNPAFSEAMQQSREHPSVAGMEMSSYLIMPIQRIPRYVMLLTDLFKNTPETHKDYTPLKDALTKMENVAQYVNKKKREAENLLGVTTVARHLVGLDSPAEFNQPHRRYVRQGFLQEGDAGALNVKSLKTRYLFLFNDIIVGTKEYTGVLSRSKIPSSGFDIDTLRNTDAQFKYLYSFQLLGALIHEIPEQNKVANTFELVESSGKKLLLVAPTPQVKDEWIQDLDEQIMSCLEKHRSRIGVPLTEERTEVPAEHRTPSLTGTLYKRSESGAWKKRYFVLTQDVLTYYPDIVSSVDSQVAPKTMPLVFAGVVTVPLMDRPFCMRLFTKERVYVLSAESAHERLQWVNMIRSSISRRLTELDLKLKASNSLNLAFSAHGPSSGLLIGGSLAESAASMKLNRSKDNESPAPSETASPSPGPSATDATSVIAGVLGSAGSAPSSPAPSSEKRRKKEKSSTLTKKSKTISGAPAELAAANAAASASSVEEEPASPSVASDEGSAVAEGSEKKNGKKSSSKDKGTRKKKLKRDQTISKITKTGEVYKFSSGSSKVVKQKMTLKSGELQLFKSGKSKPVTVIDLLLAQSPSNNVESTTVKENTIYQFTLVTSDRKYVFGAESEEDAQAWIEVIQLAREALTNQNK